MLTLEKKNFYNVLCFLLLIRSYTSCFFTLVFTIFFGMLVMAADSQPSRDLAKFRMAWVRAPEDNTEHQHM